MKRELFIWLNHIFWFLIIAYLSYVMPVYADDYWHMTSFATGERIVSLDMIPPSVASYYMAWGGRIVSMLLIQSLLLLPRIVYTILNGFVYVLMVSTIYRFVTCRSKATETSKCILLPALYLIIWFFMPDFAEVITWTTGSITYLWMNTVILVFGLNYYQDCFGIENDNASRQGWWNPNSVVWTVLRVVWMAILGLCAGLSTEAGACALIFSLVIYVIWAVHKKYKPRSDRIAGVVACVTGYMVLMLAPGNRVRAAVSAASSEQGSVFTIYAFRIARETFYTMLYLAIPIAFSVVLYVYLKYRGVRKSIRLDAHLSMEGIFGTELMFWMIGLVSIYVLTFSSGFADRVFQFPFMMICIAISLSIGSILTVMNDDAVTKMSSAIRILFFLLMLTALVEIMAGTLYSKQADSYYDRQIFHYHIDDESTSGLIRGNGVSGE